MLSFETVASASYETDQPASVMVGDIEYTGSDEWGFWLSNGYNSFGASTTAHRGYADSRMADI
ncbi:MAG: hypothetical protein U5K37_04405 [Natrialbaceae archaeon]|nr:hypothetical protein [Natrialbaceae archaeon]